jgi:hypothetical protein
VEALRHSGSRVLCACISLLGSFLEDGWCYKQDPMGAIRRRLLRVAGVD